MPKKYPNVSGHRRKPNPDREGNHQCGKPCAFCGTHTLGEKWIQFNYMRGDDEVIRVCSKHWNESEDAIIKKALEFFEEEQRIEKHNSNIGNKMNNDKNAKLTYKTVYLKAINDAREVLVSIAIKSDCPKIKLAIAQASRKVGELTQNE